MKKINKRLEKISAFINTNDIVLDVGCDHALLGIYLYLNKNVKVVGSDIKAGPLKKAYDNLLKYNLENIIELRLGDGLKTMSSDINTVIISGMGGLSIVNILNDINEYPNVRKLIISPNNDFSLTRKEISKLGFSLEKEEMVLENNKYYLISEYKLGKNKIDNYFGKLDLNNIIVKNYFKDVYDTNLKILSKLGIKDNKKRKELIEENNCIKCKFDNKNL